MINEVAWAGTAASTSDEWIELYNPGPFDIDFSVGSGWVLQAADGTPTINLTGVIPAGGYYLLERTDDFTVSDIVADQIYSGDLGNSNEILYLFDSSGLLIDTANSNGGAWPAGSTSTFGTMERRGVIADNDTAWITNTGVVQNGLDANGNPLRGTPKNLNWATTVTATPSATSTPSRTPTPTRTSTRTLTPSRTPTSAPAQLIAINEFVPRPGRDWNNDGLINSGDEFIEVINHGTISVNLSGWTLDDEANTGSKPFVLPSRVIQPGERIVFYGSQTGLLLSDGGDGVRLLKPNGSLIDAYNYKVVNYPDQSFCRLPDNGGLDSWNTNCYPTPGLSNSLGSGPGSSSSGTVDALCPIADTLPQEFYLAECNPFGNNIWSRFYWDNTGWYGEMNLPNINDKWDVFAD
ncbi:MAG: lamin tail domain-containing protein [Anaerolineales bacterium]|nr:MAG: lamin tail domain-containing protein [Anaerolineales bacterium]